MQTPIQKQNMAEVQKQAISTEPQFKKHALTKEEQGIFSVLYYADSALNTFDVYKRVVYAEMIKELNFKNGKPIPKNVYSASKFYVLNEDGSHKQKIEMSKLVFLKWVSAFQKNYSVIFPTYSLFSRVLDEFSEPPFNWIKKRKDATGKAKALYFIGDEMRGKIKTELIDSEPIV